MNGEIRTRLPVPVTACGPLHLLALRVHRLATTGHGHEALRAADAYLAIARACGDARSVPFLLQGKMYADLHMGRINEAAELGQRLLRLHRAAGSTLSEAKTLCDLAHFDVLRSRDVDAMRNLARASVLLDRPFTDRERRGSAPFFFAQAATPAPRDETPPPPHEQLTEGHARLQA